MGRMAYAAVYFSCELVSSGRGWNLGHQAGPRATKCRPRCAFRDAVSPGCVARAFARCGSCTQESCRSRRCAFRPRSILPLQARASLKGATQRRRGGANQVLLDRRFGGCSGAWGDCFIPYLGNLVHTLMGVYRTRSKLSATVLFGARR